MKDKMRIAAKISSGVSFLAIPKKNKGINFMLRYVEK
jgi:uncharacterized membrane protein YhiD involved in acid resistance